jgi:hypothetical protein
MGSIQLPHGIHIERFACTVRDSDGPGYISVSLRAQAFDTKDETERGDTIVTLSTALQSSSTDFAEISRSNESPVGIVDNENYPYHLRLDMLDLVGTPIDLQLLGCRVALLKPV